MTKSRERDTDPAPPPISSREPLDISPADEPTSAGGRKPYPDFVGEPPPMKIPGADDGANKMSLALTIATKKLDLVLANQEATNESIRALSASVGGQLNEHRLKIQANERSLSEQKRELNDVHVRIDKLSRDVDAAKEQLQRIENEQAHR